MLTCEQALTRATGQLSAHPTLRPSALADAVALLLAVLGMDRAGLIAHPERPIPLDIQADYQRLLERRLTFEPTQYILGRAEFYGLPLRVTPAVLIPRPETEGLVEAVVERLAGLAAPRIVDVGTGSGAIAIALAHLLPRAEIIALDISPEALALAVENAAANGLAGRIRFLHSDLIAAVQGEAPWDAVVSNPPYVPLTDRSTLHPQVRDFEPAAALFAGEDGLAIYRRLIPQAADALKPGGLLALEFGFGQRDALALLLHGAETWRGVTFLPDLQQIPRVALAVRR